MIEDNMTFGEFIVAKRRARDIPARQLADALGISPVYMCDIEKDRKYAVSREFLSKLANLLLLTETERELMYDLAAFSQKSVSADLPEYIMEHKIVRTALRTAKKNEVAEEKWDTFISNIKCNEDE